MGNRESRPQVAGSEPNTNEESVASPSPPGKPKLFLQEPTESSLLSCSSSTSMSVTEALASSNEFLGIRPTTTSTTNDDPLIATNATTAITTTEALVLVDPEETPDRSSCGTGSECYRLPAWLSTQPQLSNSALLEPSDARDDESLKQKKQSTSPLGRLLFPRSPSALNFLQTWQNALASSSSSSSTERTKGGEDKVALQEEQRDQRDSYFFWRDDSGESDAADALLDSCLTSSNLVGCVTHPLSKSKSLTQLASSMTTDPATQYTPEELAQGLEATVASDLVPPRSYWIVTTAALPWMTGTAVNPLLRAAYLSQRNRTLWHAQENIDDDDDGMMTDQDPPQVTLVLPWLESADDRVALYGKDWKECTPEQQEVFVRNWLRDAANLPLEADPTTGIALQWYPAKYHAALASIFALGDLCAHIPDNVQDTICILEEPEHVNFYRAPGRNSWRDVFAHVIGVVHTNYKAYARNHYSGLLTGPLVGALSSLMVRAYCDKVVKLSPVLQSYAPEKEVVSNVHGIRQEFFQVKTNETAYKCYFIGKLLWAKGLDKLLELQACYRKHSGQYFDIDIIGSGPESDAIEQAFLGKNYDVAGIKEAPSTLHHYVRRFRQPIPAHFLGRQDHAAIGGGDYKVFINPSITEVLCTTTAEAVAMGKWVIVPRHASNEFFLKFPNCLQYSSRKEFVKLLDFALQTPLDASVDRLKLFEALTWTAATDRLIECGSLSRRDKMRCDRLQLKDKSIQEWHYALGNGVQGDMLRQVMGGGPVAKQSQFRSANNSRATSPASSRQGSVLEDETATKTGAVAIVSS